MGDIAHEMWISAALIAATVLVHGVFVAAGAAVFRAGHKRVWGPVRFLRDTILLVLMSLWLMLAHMIEIWMWAETFLVIGAFETMNDALYFAFVSYTTLGFGDVLLPQEWQLLAGAAAADGLLLFGLSAAFLVEISVKLRLGGER